MSSCESPVEELRRASAAPSSVSKRYSFSTGTQGSSRRMPGEARRPCVVCSFSSRSSSLASRLPFLTRACACDRSSLSSSVGPSPHSIVSIGRCRLPLLGSSHGDSTDHPGSRVLARRLGVGEVAAALRADGHDVTALTLPGLESAGAVGPGSRSPITSTRSVAALEGGGRPVVLAVHSGSGFSGYAASDRMPDRFAAMVYSTPLRGSRPLEPSRRRGEADELGRARGGGEPRRALGGADGDGSAAGRARARRRTPRWAPS